MSRIGVFPAHVRNRAPVNDLEFIAALVSALAWPVFLLVAALLIRRPLLTLLNSISKISHGDTAVEFDRRKKEVGASLVAEHAIDPNALPEGARASQTVGEIVSAWSEVEAMLRERLKARGIPADKMPPSTLAAIARDQHIITPELFKSIQGLRELRNLAVHGRASEISQTRASEFVALSSAVKTAILNVADWPKTVSENTSAAITGQGELATMNYAELKRKLQADFPVLKS